MPTELRSYSTIGQQVLTQVGDGTNTSTTTLMQDSSGNLSRTSFVTPNFAEKKRTGKLPQNYFAFSELSSSAVIGFKQLKTYHVFTGRLELTTTRTGPLRAYNYGSSPWSDAVLLAVRSNLYSDAVAKVQQKIKDATVDLSVVAGELRETRRMFIDIASRLKLSIDAARRHDARAVARHLSLSSSADFANLWLMINYGIKPFISDLFGAAKALERGVMKERYCLVRARSKFQDHQTKVNSLEIGSLETWSMMAECSVRVKYAITDPYLATLASLGLTNLPLTAWELVKLSFVFDWMVGIGDWLCQLDYHLGKVYLDGSFTHFYKEKCAFEAAYVAKSPFINGGSIETSQSTAYMNKVRVERQVFVGWPMQYLPVLKDPFSVSHVATAVSLLRQTWKR